ncbi:hypothetical protein CMI41_01920 [Candidatus Pacearchaeota archaeon]|nr:hypothetical protein [Candidatus Pacearchaeota archaeon]|tara:strand:- start:6454 stop:6636 length:183 start_codon:yes stop_codon:yes gene_type:complete
MTIGKNILPLSSKKKLKVKESDGRQINVRLRHDFDTSPSSSCTPWCPRCLWLAKQEKEKN